ncbi:MAG: FkbM family methyltransferase [Acidobacteriaceae bacterium]
MTWDKSVLEWLTAYLKPGDVFFDVGAHQGWLSMAAAWRTGSRGKVVAFEPSPVLVKYLRYHKRMNGLAHMEIVPKAVTKANSESTPFILKGNGDSVLNSLVDIGEAEDGPRESTVIPVEAITLDSYSQQTGLVPTMIKIDTEGAEIWACEGAKRLLAECRPALIIATHPAWLPAGQKIEDLFALLSTYGYQVVSSDTLRYKRDEFRDYLFLAEEKTCIPGSPSRAAKMVS